MNYSPIPEAPVFSVYSSSGGPDQDIHSGNYINFDSKFVDVGQTIDLETGIFTAPISGIYSFQFVGYGYHTTVLIVERNGIRESAMTNGWDEDLERDDGVLPYFWFANLQKGDTYPELGPII